MHLKTSHGKWRPFCFGPQCIKGLWCWYPNWWCDKAACQRECYNLITRPSKCLVAGYTQNYTTKCLKDNASDSGLHSVFKRIDFTFCGRVKFTNITLAPNQYGTQNLGPLLLIWFNFNPSMDKNSTIVKFGVKLLIYSQTSMAAQLKLGIYK